WSRGSSSRCSAWRGACERAPAGPWLQASAAGAGGRGRRMRAGVPRNDRLVAWPEDRSAEPAAPLLAVAQGLLGRRPAAPGRALAAQCARGACRAGPVAAAAAALRLALGPEPLR